MKIYDVSQPISEELEVYPGDPAVELTRLKDVSDGDSYTLSQISMGSHTGTHVDAPSHLFPDGASIDGLALGVLVGDCHVAYVPETSAISNTTLERASIPEECQRLLIKTEGPDAYLDANAAEWIVDKGTRLVGINTMSVDSSDSQGLDTHRVLLKAGVIILENLLLDSVEPGDYTLVCLPLKLKGGDGAPARAILIENTSLP